MNRAAAVARYGTIENGVWKNEASWCCIMPIPDDVAAGWINSATQKPTEKIYCNRDLRSPLLASFSLLRSQGLLGELKTFDGCFQIRQVRGQDLGALSMHSWAAAIDLNASENPLGADPVLSPEFVKCFTDQGLTWGGNFSRKDGMHFSLGF